MKLLTLARVTIALCCALSAARAADLAKLKVLYVGQPTNSARAKQFTSYLETNVAQVVAVNRKSFKPEEAAAFDVVLLDWQQTGNSETEWRQPSPLGPRKAWTKPTVLLGSAGLNMAVVWKVRGGAG